MLPPHARNHSQKQGESASNTANDEKRYVLSLQSKYVVILRRFCLLALALGISAAAD
jgi:membrane glycosyltransferase